jgi:hypothetical protein
MVEYRFGWWSGLSFRLKPYSKRDVRTMPNPQPQPATLLEAKRWFADRQIRHMVGCLESQVHLCTVNEHQSCVQIQ